MLLFMFALPVMAPVEALAYNFTTPQVSVPGPNNTTIICPNPGGGANIKKGLTRRVMPCIKENILTAANNFLVPFSTYLASTVAAACTLAVALWGAMVVSGRHMAITREMAVLAVKIGFVILFTANFGGLFPVLLDALDDMLGRIALYIMTPAQIINNPNCMNWPGDPPILMVWARIDCAIETLIGGVFSDFSLALGIIGFLFACLFSGSVGLFVALFGFYLIVQLLLIAAHALYIFISAYIAFAIMVMISPLFIPTILFSATKGYFEKWVRLTASFLLQPIILFAFLAMMVAAYNTIVFTAPYSMAHAFAGDDADMPGFTLGGWLLNNGALGKKDHLGKAVEVDPQEALKKLGVPQDLNTGVLGTIGEKVGATQLQWQNDIFNFLGVGGAGITDLRHFKIHLRTDATDWDHLAAVTGAPNTLVYIIRLFLSLVMACVIAYILKTLLQYLPFISASVLGSSPTFSLGMSKLAAPGSPTAGAGGGLMSNFSDKMNKAMSGAASKLDGLRKGGAKGTAAGNQRLQMGGQDIRAVGNEGIGGRNAGPMV